MLFFFDNDHEHVWTNERYVQAPKASQANEEDDEGN